MNIQHTEKGLVLEADGVKIVVDDIESTPRSRWASIAVWNGRDASLCPQTRVDLLRQQDRDKLLAALTVADNQHDWDALIARICDDVAAATAGASGVEESAKSPWDARKTIAKFLSDSIEMPDGAAADLVFPGGVTVIAAPSAAGKSICVQILAYQLALGGIFRDERLDRARVLVIDTDNPPRVTQSRFKRICESTDASLEIITRESAPLLTDEKAWKSLPADKFDVIILDSFGGATPGVSEREGSKTQTALRTLIELADQGPAVVVLENTSKDALAYRGRGEKVERVEIFYEARDVTGWTPSSGDGWWEDLPDSGDTQWQSRASRRERKGKTRVAFVCRKTRAGADPPPFVLEVDFTSTPWSITDVTQEIELAGQECSANAKAAQQQRLKGAANALARHVMDQHAKGAPLGKTDAETFLQSHGLRQREARSVITSFDAATYPKDGMWVVTAPTGWGRKKALIPLPVSLNGSFDDRKIGSCNLNKNNGALSQSFCHPHDTGMTERLPNSAIENKGVTGLHLSVVSKTIQASEHSEEVVQDADDWGNLLQSVDDRVVEEF